MPNISTITDRLRSSALFRDSFWATAGSVVGKGLSLVAGICVARFLGSESFGQYGMIRNTLLLIAAFSTFGFGYTATRYVARSIETNDGRVRMTVRFSTLVTLLFSGVMALLLLIFAGRFALWMDASDLTSALRILAVIIVFGAINTTQTGVLAGFKDFRGIARNSIISGVANFLLSVGLAYRWGLNGALTALLVSQMLNCMLNFFTVRRECRRLDEPTAADSRGLFRQLIAFSMPMAMQEGVYSLSQWAVTIILIKMSGYGQLGLYSAAMQWTMIVLFLPGIFRNVTLSHLSGSTTDPRQHKRVLTTMLAVNFTVTMAMLALVWIFSGPLVGYYGTSFDGLRSVLHVSMFAAVFTCLSGVFVNELLSLGRPWTVLCLKTLRDGGWLVGCYMMLRYGTLQLGGAQTVAAATLVVESAFMIVVALLCIRPNGGRADGKSIIKTEKQL